MISPTPKQLRESILALCEAWAAAKGTGNAIVQESARTYIEAVALPRLIPDKPTLQDLQPQPERGA